jgi:beta-phosphoglucomutase-like phosphatase (HAD superfamily)
LIERLFPGKFSLEERLTIGAEKEAKYRLDFLPQLQLIKGCKSFIEKYYNRGIKMAIGSAAIIPNIDYVLDNCNVRHYFDTIVSGEDVSKSKPDPEVFLKCAERLNIIPEQCLVFEDVPKGVEAGSKAGMKSVVITSTHEPDEFQHLSINILFYIKDYISLIESQ